MQEQRCYRSGSFWCTRLEREARLNETKQHGLREGESQHVYKRASLMREDVFISVAELQSNLIGTIPTSDIISFLPQCDSYDLMLQPLTSPLIPLPTLCHEGDHCTANWSLIYNQKKVQRLAWNQQWQINVLVKHCMAHEIQLLVSSYLGKLVLSQLSKQGSS